MAMNRRMNSLAYNIDNMRVAHHSIGSAGWTKALIRHLRRAEYTELADVEIVNGQPWFLSEARQGLSKIWDTQGDDDVPTKESSIPQVFSSRVQKHVEILRVCPSKHLSFVTTVNAVATSKEEALKLVLDQGLTLNRFIRRRFKHAIWVIFPEVDIKMAQEVSDDLLLDRGWRTGTNENTLVYVVHFHGVLYAPGQEPHQVEDAFQRYSDGRRVKHFSGVNQVRAIHLYQQPGGDMEQPDVVGVAGYATKRHYRVPSPARMLEGFPEWVWLTDKIASTESLIITGGGNGAVHVVCTECDAFHPVDSNCVCGITSLDLRSVSDHNDRLRAQVSQDETVKGSQEQSDIIANENPLSLNSAELTIWCSGKITWVAKNILGLVNTVTRRVLTWAFPYIRPP